MCLSRDSVRKSEKGCWSSIALFLEVSGMIKVR